MIYSYKMNSCGQSDPQGLCDTRSFPVVIVAIMIICFTSAPFMGQNKTIDSLKLELKKVKHDTDRVRIYVELSEIYNSCKPDSVIPLCMLAINIAEKNAAAAPDTIMKLFYLRHIAYAYTNIGSIANMKGDIQRSVAFFQKSLKIQEEITDKKGIAASLINIGVVYNNQGDIPMALDYYHRGLKIQEELKDKKGIAFSLNNIGFIYSSQGDISNALDYYQKGLKLRQEIKDKKGIATSFNNIGFIYKNQGDIPNALDYFHRSLKMQEEIKDKQGISYSLNNLGVIYNDQDDIPRALDYFHRSLNLREEIKDKKGIAASLNNIGLIYDRQGEIQRALDYFNRGLKIYEEIGEKKGIAFSLNNIGSLYKKQRDIPRALDYYHRSLKIYEEIKDKKGIAVSLNAIVQVMLLQENPNNYGKSRILEYALRSLKISKELGFPDIIKKAADVLKKIYKKQNNFKASLAMYELEIQMRDSIISTETKKASIKKQFQYEYEKKAAADSVKNAEEQKIKNAQLSAQHAQLKQEKTQRYALYGGLVLIIAFLAFVFNRFRITQRQKVIIEKQKQDVDHAYEKLHEKNQEVMDSIHYARRIQRALITSEYYIDKSLNRLLER